MCARPAQFMRLPTAEIISRDQFSVHGDAGHCHRVVVDQEPAADHPTASCKAVRRCKAAHAGIAQTLKSKAVNVAGMKSAAISGSL